MTPQPAFLIVGHVRRPHGTRGELVVESLTDHPGDVFVPGVVLRPADASGGAPDPDAAPLRVDAVRPFKDDVLVYFGGIEDRNAADRMRGLYLMLEREKLPEPAAGEVRQWELIGVEVLTPDGARVGEITQVYEQRPADLLEIRTARGTVLVPFVAHWVRELDVAARRLVLDPPEGLLE